MLPLHKKLPNSVEINGIEYDIDMSFDNVLLIFDMLKDNRLNQIAKIMTGIRMLFVNPPKLSLEEMIEVWSTCYNDLINNQGKEEEFMYDIKGNKMPNMNKNNTDDPVMDLEQDADYIYASFLQDYNIDLFEQHGKLHWYKFLSLLNGLSDSTRLRKVIEIRQMELPKGKGSEKQRMAVIKLKEHYKLKKGD